MKIVEINTVCDTGSTGRIAANVCRMLTERGHDTYFAYGRGGHPNDINGYKIGNRLDFLLHVFRNFFMGQSGFGSILVTRRLLKWLDDISPDILHIHNLHGFYINIEMLFKYIKEQDIKVVWTLHDCWSFTGQCAHYDYVECEKWKTGCYNCPIFRSNYPYSLFCDNSRKNYQRKKEAFNNVKNMVIVTPSKWLARQVRESYLGSYETKVINNGIDNQKFRLRNTELDWNQSKVYLLAVANVWTKEKGLSHLYQIMELLSNRYCLILVGLSKSQCRDAKKRLPDRVIAVTHTNNVDELVEYYQMADVYVNPTLEDTFPTTNIEALACGTPVVTFDTGGSPEIIDKNCGKVVAKEDIMAMVEAIVQMTPKTKDTINACVSRSMLYNKDERFAEYVKLIETLK